MSKKLSANGVRYALVLIIAGMWGRELTIPNYEPTITQQVLDITSFQTNVIRIISFGLPLLFVFFGGISADKYGRRLTWAILLLLYGGGMLWMYTLAPSASFRPALVAATLIGISSVFGTSPLAWLFDHEGTEGTKNSYGLLYLLLVLVILLGMGVRAAGDFADNYIVIALSSILIIVVGLWVLTFPENYGNRTSWTETAKTGINQFRSSRVLQLIVVQVIPLEFFSLAFAFSFFRFTEEVQISAHEINTILSIEYMVAALFAGIFLLLMKKIDYKKLIIYPMIFMAVFVVLMPFASAVPLFFILQGGITVFSFLKRVGVLILANDAIVGNRATALSLLVVLMTVAVVLISYVGPLLHTLEWEILSLIGGACALVSVGLLFLALRIHSAKGDNP